MFTVMVSSLSHHRRGYGRVKGSGAPAQGFLVDPVGQRDVLVRVWTVHGEAGLEYAGAYHVPEGPDRRPVAFSFAVCCLCHTLESHSPQEPRVIFAAVFEVSAAEGRGAVDVGLI